MNVVIAGGGTGGHIYPCLALANTFIEFAAKTEILFIGTAEGMEAKIIPLQGFQFKTILAQGFVGKPIVSKIRSLCIIPIGFFQAIVHLARFSPRLVIGIGGYAAGPVLFAATLFGVKRVIVEPNFIPGLMNKILAPFVHLTVVAFEGTRRFLHGKHIACLGVPVRSEILKARVASRSQSPSQPRGSLRLLVLGGSQGAHRINEAMIQALPFLEKTPISIIHQTGEKDFSEVKRTYEKYKINARVEAFINNMAEVYAVSDLVVSRAGAGTLSELAVAGLPSLLIPFPHAKGHQEKNAQPFVACGAAEIILDHELTLREGKSGGEVLAGRILSLYFTPERLLKMGEAARNLGNPNAAKEIVSACLQLVGERRT